jgi:hypothetical protein
VGYGDDIDLVLPVKKHNEEGKPLEQNATGSVQLGRVMRRRGCGEGKPGQQLIAKPSRCGNASFGVKDCCLIGLAARGFVNS